VPRKREACFTRKKSAPMAYTSGCDCEKSLQLNNKEFKLRTMGVHFCRLGTIEELMEVVTWLQLGYHRKPVGLLNVHGYFDHLLKFFDNCVEQVG
jgi:hypothetical protein